MKFNLSKIKFSRNDLNSNIKIPKTITKELAEFLGIMIGDGHIGKYTKNSKNNSYTHYELRICGNSRDKDYLETYVNNLFKKIFNASFSFLLNKRDNTLILRKNSKAIYYFLNKLVKIPSKKDKVSIPDFVMKGSKEIKSAFLRGLADADFCLTVKNTKKYPVINGTSKSGILIEQCSKILNELGIKNNTQLEINYYEKRKATYPSYRVYINGFSRVEKFLKMVGFRNQLKIDNYRKLL